MGYQVDAARKLKEKLEGAGKALVPLLGGNLVDAVWGQDRPPAPDSRLRVHRLEFAGVSVADKLASLRTKLEGARGPPCARCGRGWVRTDCQVL